MSNLALYLYADTNNTVIQKAYSRQHADRSDRTVILLMMTACTD